MQSQLPEYCNLYQLADKQVLMSGVKSIKKMDRLVSMLASDEGEASVEMRFGRNGATRYVHGTVQADVSMICQRCLQSMTYHLAGEFKLALINDEALADRIPDEYEPLVTDGEHSLSDLIEDELILAVPYVATHADECSGFMHEQSARQELEKQQNASEKAEKNSPFAVLKDMF